MTLFLVGYMGSGKSVIGEKLADVLNYDYIDFDCYIENKEKSSIQTIFKTKGEIYFRKAESTYLKDVTGLKRTIISLGGGTPCYGNNMNLLLNAEHSKTMYLKATVSTLCERLFTEKEKRPLISHIVSKENLSEFIGKHIFERAPFYEQSHITVKTDQQSVDDIIKSITLQLF